jgi:predicted TIM-barrel fold metal-dependent hydrolase
MMWGPEHGFMNPGGFSSDARIQDMEVEGIDKAVIIPSFFAMLPGVHSAPLAAALCRAYNDWVYDYCASYPDRLYPVAMVPVQDLELAGKEFQRVAGKGFRIAAARPSAMAGHPVHDPYFFPLWEKLQEAEVALLFHPFPTTDLEGGGRFLHAMGLTYLSEALAFTLDNMVSLAGLITQGVLDRFPGLRMALIESSCTWVAGVLDRLDKRFYLQRDLLPGMKTLPSEVFRRQVFISFEAAEQAAPLVAPLLQDNLIWASDYPHLDADPPAMAVEKMNRACIARELQAKVMGRNASRLFGIPLH